MMTLNQKYFICISLILTSLCIGSTIYQYHHLFFISASIFLFIAFINSISLYKNINNIEAGSFVLIILGSCFVLLLHFTITTDYLGAPWLFQIVLYSYSLTGFKKGIVICSSFFSCLVSIYLLYFILEIPFPYSLTFTLSYAISLIILSIGVFFYAYNVEQLTKEKDEKHRLLINALDEIKKTQIKLVEAEKMASLGHLVTGVAHHLNTPIGISLTGGSFIDDEANIMLKQLKMETISKRKLTDFLNNVIKMSKAICKSLVEASKTISAFKQLSLNEHNEDKIIFDMKNYVNSHIVTNSLRDKNPLIEFKCDIEENIRVFSYAETLRETLFTLIDNSINHAFDDGEKGTIKIKIVTDQTLLKIKYQDNGKGVEQRVLGKIFTPFYTSKMANNTGLGLSILYTLIHHKMHGELTYESSIGKGMTISVAIPLSELEIPESTSDITNYEI